MFHCIVEAACVLTSNTVYLLLADVKQRASQCYTALLFCYCYTGSSSVKFCEVVVGLFFLFAVYLCAICTACVHVYIARKINNVYSAHHTYTNVSANVDRSICDDDDNNNNIACMARCAL